MDLVADFVPSVMGGVAGFMGGAVAALMRQNTVRQVLAAVMGGTALGAFVSPAAVGWLKLTHEASGVIGFVGGLGIFGITTGIGTLFDRFGARPEQLLPWVVRRGLGPEGEKPAAPEKEK